MNEIYYFNEEWQEIEGYENLYEVSTYGRIRSLNAQRGKRKVPKILKAGKDRYGYLHVDLCKNGKRKTFTVHRLVAQAFILNPLNLLQVNHKDEDKTNNHVNNLEWCDGRYNINYGTRNQRHAEKMTNGKLSKAVISTDKNGVEERFPSMHEAERRYGFFKEGICMCLKGKIKTYKGRTWRYANENEEVG